MMVLSSVPCLAGALMALLMVVPSWVGANSTMCPADSLVVYEVHFETLWDRRDFPKQYPQWRPPASWSKTIGYSHDKTFHMFEMGEVASPALKQFAEKGEEELFQNYAQGSSGILDAFVMPPIPEGVGEDKTIVILDGNRSKLSMVAKILPSPDWFVGVDSHDLCAEGEWTEFVHMDISPMDAGTDNGLTFTSPNWETSPPARIRSITSNYPDHPASSFYYPERDSLPKLAQVTLRKKREYALKEDAMASDQASIFMEDRKTQLYKYELQKTKSGAAEIKKIRNKKIPHIMQRNEIEIPTKATLKKNYNLNSVDRFLDNGDEDVDNSLDIYGLSTNNMNEIPSSKSKKDLHVSDHYKSHFERIFKYKGALKPNKSSSGIPATKITITPFNDLKIQKITNNSGITASNTIKNQSSYTETSNSTLNTSINIEFEPGVHSKPISKSSNIDYKNEIIFENRVPDGYFRVRNLSGRNPGKKRKKIPKGDSMTVIDGIVRRYQQENRRLMKKRRREERRKRREKMKKFRPPRDCRVSPWSDWTPCSKTCGIGEQRRSRKVTKHARRGGKECPRLEETTWCGSARACDRKNYFNWT